MRAGDLEPSAAMPYEGRDSLVALMYRMTTTHRASRTLVLVPQYWGEFPVVGWDGEVLVRRYPLAEDADLRAGSFERVALHWVLDEVGRGRSGRDARALELALLREARRLLAPGGRVVGLAANWLCLGEREGRPVFGRSAASCRRLLVRAGFEVGGVSIAVPSGDVPRSVISAAPHAARHYFRRQLAFTKGGTDLPHMLLRRLLVEAGISRHLQGSLVFSGSTPC